MVSAATVKRLGMVAMRRHDADKDVYIELMPAMPPQKFGDGMWCYRKR